jgi:hypothetical protein
VAAEQTLRDWGRRCANDETVGFSWYKIPSETSSWSTVDVPYVLEGAAGVSRARKKKHRLTHGFAADDRQLTF